MLQRIFKGFPNRWRIDKYKELIERCGLKCNKFAPLGRLEEKEIEVIKPAMAKQFHHLSLEELSWLEFWMVLEHERKT